MLDVAGVAVCPAGVGVQSGDVTGDIAVGRLDIACTDVDDAVPLAITHDTLS